MANYISEAITIGKGTPWELEGILTIPAEASAAYPAPAVVLVHGSGPQDKDETLFENKPFLEIAEYLSANGIAVIRYDKRTLIHGEQMMETLGANLTVWEETIEDAIFAANLAKADPRIDADRVFMLGHSLGGCLAPRTHVMGGNFAGLILFAASPRLLTDIIIEQNNMVLSSMEDGPEKALVQIQVDELIKEIRTISALTEAESKEKLFLGQPAYYFWEMEQHPFADYAARTDVPMLVMQASNDLQVLTNVDYALLQDLLGKKDNVTFNLYEGLNHLFMPSTVKHITEVLAEYEKPAHIEPVVLQDIATWVRSFGD